MLKNRPKHRTSRQHAAWRFPAASPPFGAAAGPGEPGEIDEEFDFVDLPEVVREVLGSRTPRGGGDATADGEGW